MIIIYEMVDTVSTNWEIWIPSFISILTLVINIFFYIFIQPKLGYKYKMKEELAEVSAEFFEYLSELISFDSYDGVPTQIRNYSLRIHLCFKSGEANEDISDCLENLFQMVRTRKTLENDEIIKNWNDNFRKECKRLRKQIGKYCGGL